MYRSAHFLLSFSFKTTLNPQKNIKRRLCLLTRLGNLLTLTPTIMQKFPFTDLEGQDLQNQLYQLTDVQLKAEADLISLDFKKWMAEHFTLSPTQLHFIAKQSQKMIGFLSTQTAIAILNRLPIILIKPASKPDNEVADSKLIPNY